MVLPWTTNHASDAGGLGTSARQQNKSPGTSRTDATKKTTIKTKKKITTKKVTLSVPNPHAEADAARYAGEHDYERASQLYKEALVAMAATGNKDVPKRLSLLQSAASQSQMTKSK